MNGKLWGDDIINSLICIFIPTGQEIVSWKFAKLQSVITFLFFNRFSSGFHCFIHRFFTLSYEIKLNLFRISPLKFFFNEKVQLCICVQDVKLIWISIINKTYLTFLSTWIIFLKKKIHFNWIKRAKYCAFDMDKKDKKDLYIPFYPSVCPFLTRMLPHLVRCIICLNIFVEKGWLLYIQA